MEAPIPMRHTTFTIVFLLAAYITVLVVGLVGNVFVMVVVLKAPKMKTATKYFILNLTIADLLVLLFCLLPNFISSIYVPWVMGSLLCKAVPYIQGVSVCASVYSLAAISGDRLMAIRSPLRRQVTKSVARRIILLIWMWSAALALPWLLYFDLSNADTEDPSLVFCIEIWPPGMNGNANFVLGNLGLCYLFPLSFISVCHLRIWLRVRGQQVSANPPVSQRQIARQRMRASVQKLVIVVVLGFATCWLPLYVIFVRVKLFPVALGPTEEKVLDYALPIAQWLRAANSCFNPIFYAFFNCGFRLTLRRLLRGSSRTSKKLPTPARCHDHANQQAQLRGIPVHKDLKSSQLKKPVDAGESSVVKFDVKDGKFAAIKRSQTYEAAMGNPL